MCQDTKTHGTSFRAARFFSSQPFCRFRHVDYEKWATALGMATSGRLVRAALASSSGR